MQNSIVLTEAQLKNLISESVFAILVEYYSRKDARDRGLVGGRMLANGDREGLDDLRARMQKEFDTYEPKYRDRLKKDFDRGVDDYVDLDYAKRGRGYYYKVPGTNVGRDKTGGAHLLAHKLRMAARNRAVEK